MNILALDLGGTKVSAAIFNESADVLWEKYGLLEGRQGDEVADLIADFTQEAIDFIGSQGQDLNAIGVGVPGISYTKKGTVYAPNIPGWDDYPLKSRLEEVCKSVPVIIESDRSCYIMGEKWKGEAQNSENAIFIAVGTGIGAGIIANGQLIRGYTEIAGAIGWMALQRPYQERFDLCGCFETFASGGGLLKEVDRYKKANPFYKGYFNSPDASLSTTTLVNQYKLKDELAIFVLNYAVSLWGMGVANLISIFNPEKVILGGGVFGSAQYFINEIYLEAKKWAQPISMQHVEILISSTGPKTGLLGAAYLAKLNV